MRTIYHIILIFAVISLFACSTTKRSFPKVKYYEFAIDTILNFNTDDIVVTKLNSEVNADGYNYAATICEANKLLYFVSDRHGSYILDSDKSVNSHDIWKIHIEDGEISGKAQRCDSDMKSNFNSNKHEGACSIGNDGRSLYFSSCDREDGIGGCDIYYSELVGDSIWSFPENLSSEINTIAFESYPSISFSGKELYFVSDRHLYSSQYKNPSSDRQRRRGPDRYKHDLDIYYSVRKNKSDTWNDAVDFGALNTYGTESSPCLCSDGLTLLFTSNSYNNGKGGLDFYITRYDTVLNKWSFPENLGSKINTNRDEFCASINSEGTEIYYSSESDRYKSPPVIYKAVFPKSILKK